MYLARTNILPYNARRKPRWHNANTVLSGYPWVSKETSAPEFVNLFGRKRRKKRRKKQSGSKKHDGYCVSNAGNIVKVYKVKYRNRNKYKKGRFYSNGKKVPKGRKCSKSRSRLKKRLKRKRRRKYYYVGGKRRARYEYYYVYNTRPYSTANRSRDTYRLQDQKRKLKGACSHYPEDSCRVSAKCRWYNGRCQPKAGFGQRQRRRRSRFGELDYGPFVNQGYNSFGSSADPIMGRPYGLKRDDLGFGNRINPTSKYNYQMAQWATNSATPTQLQMAGLAGTGAYDYPIQKGMNQNRFYKSKNNLSGMGF